MWAIKHLSRFIYTCQCLNILCYFTFHKSVDIHDISKFSYTALHHIRYWQEDFFFTLQPRVVSDIDEIELEKQLKQLEDENREVAGDSDEEDDVEGMGELEGGEPGEEEEGEDWWGGSKYNLYLGAETGTESVKRPWTL